MLKRTLLASLVIASPAFATKTQFFKHATRTDFESGKLDGLVSTNFGELKLARAVQPVLTDDGKYASIDAMVEGLDGTVYVGTTASGKLLTLKDGKTTKLADFGEASSVGALAVTAGGDVIVGVSGERAEVQIIRKGQAEPEPLAKLPEGTQYIWSIAIAADGKIYLGTGPDGQLFELSADGKQQKVIYDSDEDNLRALAILNDTIFVGTDPEGLILKVDRTTGKAFVIYDAPESEVSALLVDPRGGQIYAATSQLVEAAEPEAAADATGRPNGNNAAHLAAPPSEAPKPAPGANGEGSLRADAEMPATNEDVATDGPATRHAIPTPNGSLAGPKPTSEPDAAVATEAAANGNAVYRIEPQGFVSEVFRDKVMIFGLARQEDQLFIATGPTGALYQLDLASEEHFAVAKLRPPQITSILSTADNRLFLGTGGGSAELSMLSSGLAKDGTFTSPVLDAGQISLFGKLQVHGAVPDATKMTVSTRSGNVNDEESPLWSDWSAPVPAARFTEVTTPSARYAQYKITLGGDAKTSPTLDAVEWAYLQPNVAPRIDSITVGDADKTVDAATGEVVANPQRSIAWASTEPNGDELRFTLSLRAGPAAPWTVLAKDLTEATYAWDTRRVADGRYEVKVEASDALANAPGMGKTASRVSEAVVVDNAPPVIGDIKTDRARGNVTISLKAADAAGVVSKLEYAVDEAQHWQTAQPSDMLNDSPAEQYVIVLPDAGAATRVVSLRCQDEAGNTAHASVTIRPEAAEPATQKATEK